MASDAIEIPAGAKKVGMCLWNAVVTEYELEAHELVLLRELVRTVDLLDDLADAVRAAGPLGKAPDGSPRLHPAVVEARQTRIALARLQAALRLPTGEAQDDPAAGRRPQRRVGARGVYSFGGAA